MLATQIIAAALLLAACFLVFGALGRLFPCNPGQPVFVSRAIGLDLAYCLLGVLYAGIGPALVAILATTPLAGHPALPQLARAPLAAQLALLLLATDFAQYWLHRAFHARALWPCHAPHHSAEQVNWTTTFRTHPVNYLAATTSLAVLARLAGFSDAALLLAGPIFFLSGVVTHANLGWTYGPLRYVIASPVFHRWHHSADVASRERNFAPMFPVWDLMFGTFHMPAGRRPEGFGAEGVPGDLVGQLLYPLRRSGAQRRDTNAF
ncbi:MAG TPA: sterol desaturase family protein [Caulobacteraceae bacterium]|jgi:sterol desaturase/sphingolipid hydroxylase (fatty acid hydroxylase superfamily)